MLSLLEFLFRRCSRLFEPYSYRIKDSKVGRNPAEGSWILLESKDAEIFVSSERGEITWEMCSLYDSSKKNWFSFDLISALLGRRVTSGIMDKNNSEFLSRNIDSVVRLFVKDKAPKTIAELNELKKARTAHLIN
jgi:hypothetical protein